MNASVTVSMSVSKREPCSTAVARMEFLNCININYISVPNVVAHKGLFLDPPKGSVSMQDAKSITHSNLSQLLWYNNLCK